MSTLAPVALPAKPAAKRTRKPATPAVPANPVVTPEQAAELAITARLAELKAAYTTARAGETSNKKALKAAKEQWENSRVVNSRLLYAAAMLKPVDGAPNRSYAARNMHMTDEQNMLTGDALKAATKSAKGSIKNYIDAGIALQAAGLNPLGEGDKGNVEAPTDAERKVVAEAFRAGNKRPAGDPASTKDTGTGGGDADGDNGDSTPPNGDALTFADLSGHLGRLDATLKAMMAANVEVTTEQAEHAMAALGTLAMTLAEYAGLDADADGE